MKYFTKEWYESRSIEDGTTAKYQNYLKSLQPYVSDEFLASLHLHDAVLQDCVRAGNDLRLTFHTQHSGTVINEVTLIDAQIQCDDGIAPGDTWLYEELYLTEKKYELHVLFDSHSGLKQLIVQAKNVTFGEDETRKRQDEEVRRLLDEYRSGHEAQRKVALDKLRKIRKEELQ